MTRTRMLGLAAFLLGILVGGWLGAVSGLLVVLP